MDLKKQTLISRRFSLKPYKIHTLPTISKHALISFFSLSGKKKVIYVFLFLAKMFLSVVVCSKDWRAITKVNFLRIV